MTDACAAPSFDLVRPRDWGGVIVASPHSGRDYPGWLIAESVLDPHALRSSEDAFVDRLIAPATHHGAATLCARIPRCVVDLNRPAEAIGGEIPSPAASPSGCRFHTRCPYARERCRIDVPELVDDASRRPHRPLPPRRGAGRSPDTRNRKPMA